MPSIPGVNHQDAVRALEKARLQVLRQGKHLVLSDRGRLTSKDDCAVAITLTDGRKIGYVPRTESEDVSGCIDDGGHYVAVAKKILAERRAPIPVVVLRFYRSDQLDDIADLNPDQCPVSSFAHAPERCLQEPRKPWWKFWEPSATRGKNLWPRPIVVVG